MYRNKRSIFWLYTCCEKKSKINKTKPKTNKISLIKKKIRTSLKINELWQRARAYDLATTVNVHVTCGPYFGYCNLLWNTFPCYPGLFWSYLSSITVEVKKLNTIQIIVNVYFMSNKLPAGGLFLPTNCSVILILGETNPTHQTWKTSDSLPVTIPYCVPFEDWPC